MTWNSCEYRQNASFKQVRGLAAGDAMSFEAVNYAGHYIRARDTMLFLDRDNGSAEFRRSATFVITEPLFSFW